MKKFRFGLRATHGVHVELLEILYESLDRDFMEIQL